MNDTNTTTTGGFKTLQQLEKEHILRAMELVGGKKAEAAKLLGITVKSVYNKLHKYEAETSQTTEVGLTEEE